MTRPPAGRQPDDPASRQQRETRRAALRAHLAEGADQAQRGDFVRDYAIDTLLESTDTHV